MSQFLIDGTILFVGLLHLYFMILEMFLWTTPFGLKVFRNSAEKAKLMAPLAANQGLYNGFLSAGLFWSVFQPNLDFSRQLKLFFLGCVFIAGVYGAVTVNRKIFFIQSLPALIALLIMCLIK